MAYGPAERVSTNSTSAAEINWESIVAYAAPAISILNAITNKRSSAILRNAEKRRKYSGRFESPTALSMAEPMLYMNRPDMPAKYMVR